jgi:phosphatidylethanolamine/phosphatidyl-N-methylethanolamine N-methyltransferase
MGETNVAVAAESSSESVLKSNFVFLLKFLRHGTTIASFWPSSKALSRATINQVDFDRAKVIVELGAGTGPITDAIMERLKPHTRFIAIERDADFARILRDRFKGASNLEIVHADVRDLDGVLKARGIETVDYFVSGLPTPSLPIGVRRRMLASIRRYLAEHGVFSNITEIPWYYLRYYKNVFKDVDFQFVAANLPPGGVYHCRAMRSVKPV